MIALDIETAPDEERIQSRQWAEYKAKKGITDDQEAALHPAFGRVVCICAYDRMDGEKLSVCGEDEKILLSELCHYLGPKQILGGHNIKGFDIPFLGNRMAANRMHIPMALQVAGKKPWEIAHVDTIELLKFGGGQYISLDAMCLMLGVPSPKEGEVNGLGVWKAYQEKRFGEIASYCGRDVNTWLKCIKILEASGAY